MPPERPELLPELREGALPRLPPKELPLLREGLTERDDVEGLDGREGVLMLREGVLTLREGAEVEGRCVTLEDVEPDGRLLTMLFPLVPPNRRPMLRGEELGRVVEGEALGAVVRVLLSRTPCPLPERPKRLLPPPLPWLPPTLPFEPPLRLPNPLRSCPVAPLWPAFWLRLPKVRLLPPLECPMFWPRP